MDTNFSNQNQNRNNKPPFSQTGSSQEPIQVENVQYNVKVRKFSSRVGFAFMTANLSLIFLTLILTWTLYGIAEQMFSFGKMSPISERIILLIAVFVPVLPLHLFSANRFKKLIENPVNLEDIIFKKHLRRTLFIEVIIGVFFVSTGIYVTLNIIFLDSPENIFQTLSRTILWGGAFAFLALWTYSFQKLTQR